MVAAAGSGLFDLTGKTALVTGSSRGIGHALAEGPAGAGARLVLNGRDEARARLAAKGATVSALAFDACDHAAVRAAVDGHEARSGPIDVLVNNAGAEGV